MVLRISERLGAGSDNVSRIQGTVPSSPVSGTILRQASSQGKPWHKQTHMTVFLRIIFAEREELGVKLKQRSVLGQLYLTELHCGPWLQLPQPQQLEFLTVSCLIPIAPHPSPLTQPRAGFPVWQLQVVWLLLPQPQVLLTQRTLMNA